MASKIDVDRLEFIVLAERAGLNRVPVVASFSHYGTRVQDIPREYAAAEQRCRERGLLAPGGELNDRVLEVLGIYSRAAVEYDLRFSMRKETELRVAVTQADRVAVRTVVDGDRIVLEPVRPSDAIPALVSTLPEHAPARIRPPLSMDLTELRAVMADVTKRGETDPRAVEAGLRSRGMDVRGFRQITQLLDGERLGAGEVGATIWTGTRKEVRCDRTVKIVDLPSGRIAIYNSAGQRMLAGADLGTFNRILGDMVTRAQRETAW